MSKQQFDEQLEGEQVVFMFRKHPVVMRKGLIMALFGPVLGILPTAIWPQLGFDFFFLGLAVGILAGAVLFTPSYIRWYFSVFIVTDQRLVQISRSGFFSKSIVDLSLKQILSVNYEVKGLQETMLKYGTLMIQTYIGDLIVHDVENPAEIYKKMLVLMNKLGIEPQQLAEDE